MGRPTAGPGSIARIGPRSGALLIDWAIASAFAYLLFDGVQLAILGCFAALQFLFVGFFGHSIGHRSLRMQVQTLNGRPAGYGKAALRTVLICLVVPPLLIDRDQRGLHDRLGRTVLVRI
ncbi:RDD family protein [Arthrobacter roseus]